MGHLGATALSAAVMKFFLASVFALCVLPQVCSIKCYECAPDMQSLGQNFTNPPQNLTQEQLQKLADSLPFCQKPTRVLECPPEMNTCMDIKISMSFMVPVVNLPVNLTMHQMNCTNSTFCGMKQQLCGIIRVSLGGGGLPVTFEDCDMDCCENDKCNDGKTSMSVAPTTGVVTVPSRCSVLRGPAGVFFALVALVTFRVFH